MALAIGVLMDPIDTIKPKKDSTLALCLEGQRRGHRLYYLTQGGLAVREGKALARMAALEVADDTQHWYRLGPEDTKPFAVLDLVMARKDPPVDAAFVHDTLVLDLAEREGVRVVNRPQALRDANEKLFAQHFPSLCPPTLVARDLAVLREFVQETGQVVIKPLDGMAGRGIFRSGPDDPNLISLLETVTAEGQHFAMLQRYLPEITAGDKRVLVIGGEVVPYALARVPQGLDFRGNMARGGKPVGQPLSAADRRIAEAVAPELLRRGIYLAGLDVIGEHLTEINVTSPTGIRELDAQFGLNLAGMLFDYLERLPRAAP
jgi:glutathione synthase